MITTFFIASVISILIITQVVRPVLQYNQWRDQRDYDEELRLYKLRVVKNFYPVLKGMTYDEIHQKYGMSRIYDSVGRAYLQHRMNRS